MFRKWSVRTAPEQTAGALVVRVQLHPFRNDRPQDQNDGTRGTNIQWGIGRVGVRVRTFTTLICPHTRPASISIPHDTRQAGKRRKESLEDVKSIQRRGTKVLRFSHKLPAPSSLMSDHNLTFCVESSRGCILVSVPEAMTRLEHFSIT